MSVETKKIKEQQIQVCMINARLLRNKFSDLEALAVMEKYDIISITESWLKTTNRDFWAEFNLPGYIAFSNEKTNMTGGVVLS